MLLVNLYSRLTASTGGVDDDDDSGGYGILDGACGGTLAVFCVLAVSVVVWKACAFLAMAAALLAIGWRVVTPRSWRRVGAVTAGATPACGLTAAAIDALPASEYERPLAGGSGSAPACSVCLEDVRGGETVRRLPACGHLYHAACIDAWLRLHTTCPLCRCDLSPRQGGTASGRARPRLMTHESLLPPLPSV